MRLVIAALAALAFSVPVAAQAQQDSAAVRASYWGPVPPEAKETRVTYPRASTHPVEHAILTPFYVVTYPIYITTRVLKKGLVFADEHNIVPGLGPSLPIRFGNLSMGPAVTAGGHAGLGGGATVLYEGGKAKDRDLTLRYITTVKGMRRASAGFRAPWGERSGFEAGAGYRRDRNAKFYGIGPTASESGRSFYTQEMSWGGVGYRRKLDRTVTAEGRAIYSSITTRAPRPEDTPGIADLFPTSLPEGYGERTEGVLYTALLRHDTTHGSGRPEPGTVAQAEVTYFGPTRNETAFWRYNGEAGAFVPLWFTDRTLGVRGAVTWTGPTGSDVVTFTRLVTNHSGESLRGFNDYRWRDRGLVDLTAEYRWPVWALDRPHGVGVDAYLFFDSGQVFGDWSAIKARTFRSSLGGGFRAILSSGFGARLEYARSRESTEIRLQADQMFDFKDMGLFGGNYHVAVPN